MTESIVLKFKTVHGDVAELPVAELIEIDGRPFVNRDLDARLDRIEEMVTSLATVVLTEE